jgi:hypothetical protein
VEIRNPIADFAFCKDKTRRERPIFPSGIEDARERAPTGDKSPQADG